MQAASSTPKHWQEASVAATARRAGPHEGGVVAALRGCRGAAQNLGRLRPPARLEAVRARRRGTRERDSSRPSRGAASTSAA